MMGTAVTSEMFPAPTCGIANDDPFHDPLLIGIGIMFVVYAVVVLALTGLFYWGTMYDAPSWGANSFPPPIVH
jgi:hypothetical protein